MLNFVVSYRNSTSNHNNVLYNTIRAAVVSYRNSTSNHNNITTSFAIRTLYLIEILHQTTTIWSFFVYTARLYLIEILHQTTTNCMTSSKCSPLYLIEILHQTTTIYGVFCKPLSCILSKFYIKPQPPEYRRGGRRCCILSKFYIKPQRTRLGYMVVLCCILSKFYIKPQRRASY